jgi:hypothetical protein
MNSDRLISIERICVAFRGSAAVRAVRAVRAAVWGSTHGSSVRTVRGTVFLVVNGSVHGSVLLSGSVRQCAAVCGSSAAVGGSGRQCATVCGTACVAMRQCAKVRPCVAERSAVCGSVRGRVRQCVAVCGSAHGSLCMVLHSTFIFYFISSQSRSQYIYWYALTAAVGMSPLFLAYFNADC